MAMTDPELRRKFEKMGVDTTRARLLVWSGRVKEEAVAWLQEQDENRRKRFRLVIVVSAVIAIAVVIAAVVVAIVK